MTGATENIPLNMSNVQTLGLTGNSNNRDDSGAITLTAWRICSLPIPTMRQLILNAWQLEHQQNSMRVTLVTSSGSPSDTTAVNDGIGSSGHKCCSR